MSWTSHSIKIVAASVALFCTSSAIAGAIVIRSTGPSAKSLPAGKSLPDNSQLSLKAGDVVTVLSGGSTRILTGPGNFNPSAAATTATGSTLGRLLSNTTARQSRTGATRGTGSTSGKPPRSPSLWYVDISKSGAVCLAGTAAPLLWRPASMAGQMLTVTNVATNSSAAVEFSPGMVNKPWPSAISIKSGAEYRISGDGLKSPTLVKIVTLDSSSTNIETTVSALAQNGCNKQLDLIADAGQ